MIDAYDVVSSSIQLWFSLDCTRFSWLGTFKISAHQIWAYKVQAMYRWHGCLPNYNCLKETLFKHRKFSSRFLWLCCISPVDIVHQWYKDSEHKCETSWYLLMKILIPFLFEVARLATYRHAKTLNKKLLYLQSHLTFQFSHVDTIERMSFMDIEGLTMESQSTSVTPTLTPNVKAMWLSSNSMNHASICLTLVQRTFRSFPKVGWKGSNFNQEPQRPQNFNKIEWT